MDETNAASPPRRKRRWYQFSLRTLLIAVSIIAIPCALLGQKLERKRGERKALAALAEYDGQLKYDDDPHDGSLRLDTDGPGPEFLKGLLGEDFFHEVSHLSYRNNRQIDDDGLQYVSNLVYLQTLDLDGTRVTNVGVRSLIGLVRLKELDLRFTRVTEAGAVEIQAAMPNCKVYY